MEKQISIIIPTYNMEKYIGKCLDSLLIPEFDQVEVLVVNDGSKDRSSEIAHEYADRYPASIRVIDKPNGNYGSCINAALPLATGRYVKILDADDTFDTDVFSIVVKSLSQIKSDLLLTSYQIVESDGSKITDIIINNSTPNNNMPLEDAIKTGNWNIGITMHGVAYKTDLFNRLDYKQTEGISFTDTEWVCYPLESVTNVYIFKLPPLYKYLLGREGQTVDPKIISQQIPHYFKILNRLISERLIRERDSIFNEIMEKHIIRLSNLLFRHIIEFRLVGYISDLQKIDQKYLKYLPNLYLQLNMITYFPHIPYRFIHSFRKSGYDSSFKIPYYVCICKILILRLHSLLSRSK